MLHAQNIINGSINIIRKRSVVVVVVVISTRRRKQMIINAAEDIDRGKVRVAIHSRGSPNTFCVTRSSNIYIHIHIRVVGSNAVVGLVVVVVVVVLAAR